MILAATVGAVSGVGAVARYLLESCIQRQHRSRFPFGTLTVNVIGSLLLGLVTGWAVHYGLPPGPTVVLSAGFCSGFSTWSTYIGEALALLEVDALGGAVLYLFGSLFLGVVAAATGYGLALL
ncbi:MAG: CrcB family protein [Frankiaceae bacterium]